MELTASIIFFGALLGIILWIYRTFSFLTDPKTRTGIILGEKVRIGVSTPLILFIIMAITAGVAWG